MLTSVVIMEDPFFCFYRPIQWPDCDIYFTKNNAMGHNVTIKARYLCFLINKTVGL